MKAFLLGSAVALAFPAGALAGSHSSLPPGVVPIVPPSNSAANQYVENVPTASGGRSTSSVKSGSPGAGASTSSQALSPATATALQRQGRSGAKVAAFVRATAPRNSHSHKHSSSAVPLSSSSGGGPSGGGNSGIGSLLRSITGTGTHGGLGAALPVALVLSLLAIGALALRRRRAS